MPGRSWLLARAWIPVFALAALVLEPAGTTLRSTYTLRWLAAGLVLIAAMGRRDRRALFASAALGGAGAVYIAIDSAVRIAGGATPARTIYIAAAAVVLALSLTQLRTRYFDPLMLVALQLAIGLFAYWVFYQASGLALDPNSYGRESLPRLAGTELSLLALAFAAVGLGVTRTWQTTVERLGWTRPAWWNVALAIFVASLFLMSTYPVDLVTYIVTPKSLRAIAHILDRSFAGLPWWTFPIFAIMAGVGEETMFRGALQPRFGVVLTAVLFALIHVQYGVTPVLGWLFVHGLAYGLLRRHLNTTTAILAHSLYDFGAYIPIGFVGYGLIAALMGVYLWGPFWANRTGIWREVRQGFIDERKGLQVRSYLSTQWRSQPSSTD